MCLGSENEEEPTKNVKQIDLTIDSPFKSSNSRPKHKTQLKLTKMQNYNLKTVNKESSLNCLTNDENKEIKPTKPNELSDSDLKKASNTNPNIPSQTWKIKATIDNRNFLIPIA